MKDVSVIIINYNSSRYTLECIAAVVKMTSEGISYEVIVVDNNSELPDYTFLKNNFPGQSNISLHRSNLNTGFGGGNMYGTQFANGRYLLFLNNDATLRNDCLSLLHTYMEKHPAVGVCTAQNFDEQGQRVPSFDHNKGLRRFLFGRSFLEKNNPARYPKRSRKYSEPVTADWLNGAFLFCNAEAFAMAGGFDTNIFLYWEEMDLCSRLRKLGFKSVLVPSAEIMHYQGVSIGTSRRINKEAYISYLYVVRKNQGFGKYLLLRGYLLAALLLKPRKWHLLPVLLKGNALTQSMKQHQKMRYLYEG